MKLKIAILAIMIFSIIIVIFATYGSVQLCKRLELVEIQKQKIIELETHILWLEKSR